MYIVSLVQFKQEVKFIRFLWTFVKISLWKFIILFEMSNNNNNKSIKTM